LQNMSAYSKRRAESARFAKPRRQERHAEELMFSTLTIIMVADKYAGSCAFDAIALLDCSVTVRRLHSNL